MWRKPALSVEDPRARKDREFQLPLIGRAAIFHETKSIGNVDVEGSGCGHGQSRGYFANPPRV